MCAIKAKLQPFLRIPLDLNTVVALPKPVPYCTSTQETLDSFITTKASNEPILIKDISSCNIPLKIVVGAQLGDRLWNDLNRNGIQDNNESGIGGSQVELYACTGGNALASM